MNNFANYKKTTLILFLCLSELFSFTVSATADRPLKDIEIKNNQGHKPQEADHSFEQNIKSEDTFKNDKSSKNDKNKFEELLIWKLSDDLKLTVSEEKKFSEWMRELNHKKAAINNQIESVVRSLSELSANNKISLKNNDKEYDKLLIEYRRLLKSYNELSIKEVDNLQKIIGVNKTGQYLVFKSDLTNKLKQMLTPNEKTSPLPPPKVIQE